MAMSGMGPMNYDALFQDEKKRLLDATQPKIVDEKKYRGAAVTDFKAIKDRMKTL